MTEINISGGDAQSDDGGQANAGDVTANVKSGGGGPPKLVWIIILVLIAALLAAMGLSEQVLEFFRGIAGGE